MAVTQNTYTGDGSTVLFSFTFPYLETTDIKVSLNGTVTTAYTLANATTVQFNTAPVNGAAIRIYRETDDSNLQATFYPGSAIRSSDLNDNFTQNLYVTQEANNVSAAANTTANTALTNSNTAISTANTALSTANTASTNASAAVTTANTASTNASAAVSTANTASANASAAVTTANSAAADAATALSTANTALSTANTASTNASAAVSTANTASSNASSAVSTANTASSNASAAVSTANTASSNASTALSTANTAISTANAAASAVANAILYDTVANVAAIPGSPANNDAVEVVDSTGIESFTPLSGVPTGFVGDSGLSVRLVYTTTGSTWNWIQYFPNDPEDRYGDAITTLQTDLTAAQGDITTLQGDITTLQGDITTLQGDVTTLQSDVLGLDNNKLALAGGTMTGALTLAADPTTNLQAATKQYVDTGLSGISADKITEGNTSAEVIDTGSDGRFVVNTDGVEALRVDASRRLLVGTTTPRSPETQTPRVQIEGTDGPGSALSVSRISGDAGRPTFAFVKARSVSNGAILNGDYLGSITWNAGGGSSLVNAASIEVQSEPGTISDISMPARIVFATTADGASSATERLRIANNGAIGLSGANYGTSGQVLTSQGSGAAPQWATPGGGWTFISSVTASTSSSVALTSGLDSTYTNYAIIIDGLFGTVDNTPLWMRVSTNGGSSYLSTNVYNYSSVASSQLQFELGIAQIKVSPLRDPASGGLGLFTIMYLIKPNLSSTGFVMLGMGGGSGATVWHMKADTAKSLGNVAVNAIQFLPSTGAIHSGNFSLYGLSN